MFRHVSPHRRRCQLIAEYQRGTSGQNLLNAHLPISGAGSAKVIQNTEFRIFELNQTIVLFHNDFP